MWCDLYLEKRQKKVSVLFACILLYLCYLGLSNDNCAEGAAPDFFVVMEKLFDPHIVWVTDTDLIVYSSVTSSTVTVWSGPSVTGLTLSISTWLISWLDPITKIHKNTFLVSSDGTSLSMWVSAPKSLTRVYIVIQLSSDTTSLNVINRSVGITSPKDCYLAMWDFTTVPPNYVWETIIDAPAYKYPLQEVSNGIISSTYSVKLNILLSASSSAITTSPRPDSTNPSIGVQKLDFSGNSLYSWSMGATGVVTCGDVIQVDPQSDLACGAPETDASAMTNNFDLDPSQSVVLSAGESTPSYKTYDVLIGCWNLSSSSLPSPVWTYRLSSSAIGPTLTTRQLKNAFTNPYIVQSVTRKLQDLLWLGGDVAGSLPASIPSTVLNSYFWGRDRLSGQTSWRFSFQTDADAYASELIGADQCQTVAAALQLANGMSSYDFSLGSNTPKGQVGPLLDDTLVIVFFDRSSGSFVNLLTVGTYDNALDKDAIIRGTVAGPSCRFVFNAVVKDFKNNTCSSSTGPYKIIFTVDSTGTPTIGSPSCTSASITPTSSLSPTESNSISLSPTVSVSSTNTPSYFASPSVSNTPSISTTLFPSSSSSASILFVPSATVSPSSSTISYPSSSPTSSPSISTSLPSQLTSTPTPTVRTSSGPSGVTKTVTRSEFDLKNAELVETSVNVTKSIYRNGVKIDLIAKGRDGRKYKYGDVTVPPQLVPIGWTIDIYRVNSADLNKPKPSKDECGSDKKKNPSEIVSIAFNMIIRDEHGRQRSLEDLLKKQKDSKGLGLELSYFLDNKQKKDGKSLKIGYLGDKDSSWKFLDGNDSPVKDNFGNAKGHTNHLTSFAVLLSFGNGDGCSNTLWIVSLSLLGSIFVFSILFIIAVERIRFLKRAFYGYTHKAKSIRTVETNVKKALVSEKSKLNMLESI
eukprot:TRINITY_DN6835_c0_g5_i1.p1 TRINITY_DN6835_c0_g5~~TRINITY_DN6835_c0_g5_i1.p1  ORF type:complete len:945 (-),score=93.12 TRINITY_DN6835_c0_g5_i1:82-2832(-)